MLAKKKPKLGQHFLTDMAVGIRIVEFAGKKGLRYLTELGLEMLRKFGTGPSTIHLAATSSSGCGPYLRFSIDSRWIAKIPIISANGCRNLLHNFPPVTRL